MERRNFIKISALSGVAATLDGCRGADKQLIRFIPGEELIPGIATFKLPVGSHGLSAKYQNPNQTCTAILTTPAEGLVTATCNPD